MLGSAAFVGVGVSMSVKPFKELYRVDDRPHPSPLPQERENQSALHESFAAARAIAGSDDRRDAQRLLPLPGGEGRGEGERSSSSTETSIDYHDLSAPWILASASIRKLALATTRSVSFRPEITA